MATTIQSNADPAGDLSPRLTAAIDRFDAALAEWLAARADLASRHDDESEEAERKRADRERAAEMALIATPAPNATDVWAKWSFVEHLVNADLDGGPSPYPATIVALTSLKADVAALGLKPWPDE